VAGQAEIVVGREQQRVAPSHHDLGVGPGVERPQLPSQTVAFEALEVRAERIFQRLHSRHMPGGTALVNHHGYRG